MKTIRLIITIAAITLASAAFLIKSQSDVVILSGKILNPTSDTLTIFGVKHRFKKAIKINKDGTFSTAFDVKKGLYFLTIRGKARGFAFRAYLKNGYDLQITLDANDPHQTLAFSGIGSEASNFLAKAELLQNKYLGDYQEFGIEGVERPLFEKKLDTLTHEFLNLLSNTENLDTAFIALQKKEIADVKTYALEEYDEVQFRDDLSDKPSPTFTNYQNYKGGTTSLEDFKGKYVYVDIWATWCGPCITEIPYLKAIEKAYHDKNIAFVSISIDDEEGFDRWKKMVKQKELTGTQLFADKDWRSPFVKAYRISGIPHFILIDPEGKVVSANAPRPSETEKLKTLFQEQKIETK